MRFAKVQILLFVFFTFSSVFSQTLKLYELNSISFEGNKSVPEHLLRGALFSQETPNFLSKFLYNISPSLGNPPVYFDSLLVAKDEKNLLNLYKSNGFFKAKISHSVKLKNDKADLIFFIKENERAKLDSIEKIGFDKIPKEFVEKINAEAELSYSEFFSAKVIENFQKVTLDILEDNGYYSASFDKTRALIDTNKNIVDITIILKPGERYKIKSVSVELGQTEYAYVEPEMVKEIVNVEEGEWFNKTEIEQAEARLYRTDLFSSSMIQIGSIDSVEKQIPLNAKVTLKARNDIAPEIIVNNEDNVFNFGFSLGFTRRNFFGSARKLNLQASATVQDPLDLLKNVSAIDSSFYGYGDIRLGVEQPFLFGKPIYTKLETYYTLQNRRDEYYSQIYGVRLLFDFAMPKYVFFNGLTAFVRSENSTYHYKKDYVFSLFKNYIMANYPPEEQDELLDSLANSDLNNFESQGQNFFIGADAVKNNTNDFRFPTRGYSVSLHFEDGNNFLALLKKIFFSEFDRPQYLKAIINAVYYPERLSTFTSAFGIKLRIGEIYLLKGNKNEIPLDERLYAGGSNSIRGWRNRELVPNNAEIDINASNPNDLEAILLQNFTPGGFSLLEGSFEFRKKIIGNFGGAVFVDYGNTWLDFTDFRWDEVAVAGGFGIRYYTDFFPIRLDFGFKLYDPYDKRSFFKKTILSETFNFHLGIGEAF